jgi:hypothetical protein
VKPPTRNETLAECALLAVDAAAKHCDDRAGCGAHHALWPTMRLLEMLGSPDAPEDLAFWTARADALRSVDEPRVLISGASDHGFVELVHGLLRGAGVRANLCLVDRCQTPLELNRWYAGHAGIDLELHRSDILAFTAAQPFDAIFAHCFIDQLAPEMWPALVDKWRALLRSGGLIASLSRVRNAGEAQHERAAVAVPIDYSARIARKNLELPPTLQIPIEIASELERHWRRREPSPVRATTDIVPLFDNGGFAIEVAEQAYATVAGRSFAKSRRLRLTARKR